jgi:hypothetical protein
MVSSKGGDAPNAGSPDSLTGIHILLVADVWQVGETLKVLSPWERRSRACTRMMDAK